jgi:hypothetical protein
MKLGFEAQKQQQDLQMKQVTNQQTMAMNEEMGKHKLEMAKKQAAMKPKPAAGGKPKPKAKAK